LTSVTSSAGTTTIQGTLKSTASTTFRIEFFANTAADPSGFGEGQTFLGSVNTTTDGSGNASFTSGSIPTPTGTFFTATATRLSVNFQLEQLVPVETSEFSAVFTPQAVAATVTINQAATQADPTSASRILF